MKLNATEKQKSERPLLSAGQACKGIFLTFPKLTKNTIAKRSRFPAEGFNFASAAPHLWGKKSTGGGRGGIGRG